MIRIFVAQSSAKLRVLQRIRYSEKPFRRVLSIWATVLEQNVVELSFKSKKVLEVTSKQALKVSNNLVNVVYFVSQVPWKQPVPITKFVSRVAFNT